MLLQQTQMNFYIFTNCMKGAVSTKSITNLPELSKNKKIFFTVL